MIRQHPVIVVFGENRSVLDLSAWCDGGGGCLARSAVLSGLVALLSPTPEAINRLLIDVELLLDAIGPGLVEELGVDGGGRHVAELVFFVSVAGRGVTGAAG